MTQTNKWVLLGAGLVLSASPVFVACTPGSQSKGSAQSAPQAATAEQAIPEKKISLRSTSVFEGSEILAQPEYSMKDAGESQKIERSFYDAPPAVPHALNYGQGKGENECIDCHDEGDKDTPAIPPSHRIKAVIKSVKADQSQDGQLHQVTGHAKVKSGINNERFYCTTCHVPQAANIDPLVENDFAAAKPKDSGADMLDSLNTFVYGPILGDDEISLRHDSVFNESVILAAPMYSSKDAGESHKLSRSFYDAPPAIPHSLNYDEKKGANECLDCHEEGDKDTPSVPASHRIKAIIESVTAEASKMGQLHEVHGHAKVKAGINLERFYCTTCHVPQAENIDPLIENTFNASKPSDGGKDVLDQLNNFSEYK